MKPILSLLFLAILLVACTPEEVTTSIPEAEKWELVKMSGQLINSETTGADMEWQEFYLIEDDGSFVKSRTQDGMRSEATGTAMREERSDGLYLIFKYSEDSPLIGNCTGLQSEELYIEGGDKLIGTWQACDGPGLEYSRLD